MNTKTPAFGETEEHTKMEATVESNGGLSLGGSLPVDNVQALAATISGGNVPPRYIREVNDGPVEAAEDSDEEIPVINFSRLVEQGFIGSEAAKLQSACEDWGFFQLINHGIAEEVIERMKVEFTEFFQLPLAEKEKLAQLPDSVEGYGQAFVISEDQKLDWADMLYLTTLPLPERKLRFWPTHPPTFRATLDNYSKELKSVSNCLFEFMANNLGLDPPEKLSSMFQIGTQSMRMNYYPPCSQADKVLGISPHSDAVGLTFLLQVNDVQGLQIKRKGGWLNIKPLPHAFIVNIGDVLEIMSNGRYRSIEHRAVVNTEKERLSIAVFHSLKVGDMVGPIAELVGCGEVYYNSLVFEEYIRQQLASKLEGKDNMKLKK